MSQTNSEKDSNYGRQQTVSYLLFGVASLLLLTAVVVMNNNSARLAPVFIFLFLFGVGAMLGLGITRGALVGMLVITVWIITKQRIGLWTSSRLLISFLEVALMFATFAVSGLCHDRLKEMVEQLADARNRLKQLDFVDKSTSLIKTSIGMLRLSDEQDRSTRFRRPFSLVLIHLQPRIDLELKEENAIMRAVAANIKDVTRAVDFPFLAAPGQIALLLPETDRTGTKIVIEHISERMVNTRSVDSAGMSIPIKDRVQILFGCATYTGQGKIEGNIMDSARQSLKISITNANGAFLCPVIEFSAVGDCPETIQVVTNKVLLR